VLVWNSPRREGVLPAGDKRGNWIVTWFQADVLHDLMVIVYMTTWSSILVFMTRTWRVFPRLRKRGLRVCPGLKRRELELERRRSHRERST
jgi:hypothetical protein